MELAIIGIFCYFIGLWMGEMSKRRILRICKYIYMNESGVLSRRSLRMLDGIIKGRGVNNPT